MLLEYGLEAQNQGRASEGAMSLAAKPAPLQQQRRAEELARYLTTSLGVTLSTTMVEFCSSPAKPWRVLALIWAPRGARVPKEKSLDCLRSA